MRIVFIQMRNGHKSRRVEKLACHGINSLETHSAKMSELTQSGTKLYEIRLITSGGDNRLFATAAESDEAAADYAKRLLLRHADCEQAELWCGMRMIRQL